MTGTLSYFVSQKGEAGNKLFIIISGTVEVLDDEGVILAEMGEGEVFGELSLISGESMTTTIQASEPCIIATLNKKISGTFWFVSPPCSYSFTSCSSSELPN